MSVARMLVLGMAVLLLAGSVVLARPYEQSVPDPSQGYKWQEAARKFGFTDKGIEVLARQKVLVRDETYKQVFAPYIKSALPLFITSDSLLNAYHVLYEESVFRLEKANARKLPNLLRFIWTNLQTADKDVQGSAELTRRAKVRAQIVVGTALRLLGDDSISPAPEEAAAIAEEVQKVVAATVKDKPAWLGTRGDSALIAIDYSRYKPRGFYTKSAELERYFRAVSWLQSIPFRVAEDEELLSVLMVASTIVPKGERPAAEIGECNACLAAYREFIGAGDDWDLARAAAVVQAGFATVRDGQLPQVRREIDKQAAKWGSPMVNDQLRLPPLGSLQVASEPNFRIISAYGTPDAVLFTRTTDLRRFIERKLPTGLDVAAALGSDWAREKIAGSDKPQVLKAIDETKPLFKGDGLYLEYMDCLKALLAKPHPASPAFMTGEAWQAKSCQTVLGGWAQLRHTWSLQAKQSVTYAGITMVPPGFVEPQPEFYSRMAKLARRTEGLLRQGGAIAPDFPAMAADVRAVIAMLEKNDVLNLGGRAIYKDYRKDDEEIISFASSLMQCLGIKADTKDAAKYGAEMMDKLKALAASLERGEMPAEPNLAMYLKYVNIDLAPLWKRLAEVSEKLEALARKQLRGEEFQEDDNLDLRRYGIALGGIMLYAGNSYEVPRDDAPRLADVHSDDKGEKYLEVGIGRPRALYVLYPYKGGEVLCRGAVMPYYEFPSGERLTDEQWKTLLDSKDSPDVPDWVKPIIGPGMIKPVAPAKE